jgi:hypothetical protein
MDKNKFDGMSDTDLFYSVGSHRPQRGGLADIIQYRSDEALKAEQEEFDEAVAEMRRRHKVWPFPYWIPGGDE